MSMGVAGVNSSIGVGEMYSGWGSGGVAQGGWRTGVGRGSFESGFPPGEIAASREDTGQGESQDSYDYPRGRKVQAWRVCGAEGCVGGPTGKAWNVKIRAWKLGVTFGLHALRSRRVGGYGRKKQEMGEEAVRTWGRGWESQAEEKEEGQDGALTQPGARPSLLGSLNSHLAAPSTRAA